MEPIYAAENTKPAFQLNWSVALFGKFDLPPTIQWIDDLRQATEPDGVRILEHHNPQSNVVQFLVSSRPSVSPSQILRTLKGRLQYRLRDHNPKLFRRNYSIHSIGEAKVDQLDNYIARQTEKHPMADPTVQARFENLQFYDPSIDLMKVQTGNYGQFLYNLQIVIEMGGNWNETRTDVLTRIRKIVISAAAKHDWKLSRIALLSNHLHVLLGANVKETPESTALALMNNVAFVYDMTPVLKPSFYVGTFGAYDRGAVRKVVASGRDKLDGAPESNDWIG